ncbi:pyridoxal phosphate-dependent aminotransferase [Lentisalinibacter orientalis]|uniref:pyridoxal phosphate-dependent aminotransferase n=1 Tax=Lentisalinibacter orientalis TaxID=2992241 RepID=UPI003862F15A
MSLTVSSRLSRVRPSPTMAVTALAAELRAAGRDVIGLGAGEPDFDTPEHIREAAIEAIRAGRTRYTAVDGIAELREAVAEKFRRDNGLEYAADRVIVSGGAKQICYNVCQAVLNPGDEAVIQAPYWVSYPDMVRLAAGEPVIVETGLESGFRMRPEQLEAAITPRTRLVILNSPGNPSGAGYRREELAALGEVLAGHPDIVVATDEIYEHIWWADEPFTSLAGACPALFERTVTINGVSKCYAMTGWRIGYAAGPATLVGAMKKIQSQSTSNACTVSQYAALAALTGDQSCVAEMNRAFRQRHDFVVDALNGIDGVACRPGEGTFYAFADAREAIARLGLADDTDLCQMLLNEAGVALVPGSAFGTPGHFRLSYACGLETLRDALGRLESALGRRDAVT